MALAGPKTLGKLDELGSQLADAQARKKQAEADIKRLNEEMFALADRYALPERKPGADKSEFATVGSGQLRITRPEAPVRRIQAETLKEQISDLHIGHPEEAALAFMEVVILPQFIDIDADAWAELVGQERVADRMLAAALEGPRKAPKASVHWTPAK